MPSQLSGTRINVLFTPQDNAFNTQDLVPTIGSEANAAP